MLKTIRRLLSDRRGLVALEQALIISLTTVVVIVALAILSERLRLALNQVANGFLVAG